MEIDNSAIENGSEIREAAQHVAVLADGGFVIVGGRDDRFQMHPAQRQVLGRPG